MGPAMGQQPGRPNPLVERWEALSTGTQALIAVPSLVVLLFLLNLGPFSQPLLRSVLYGLLEGGVFAGILLAVTAQQKGQRSGAGARPPEEQQRPARDQREREDDPEDLSGEA